jgi:eukaryotic-like serine/threonine-protein kinase
MGNERIGKFRLDKLLGQGGMGSVYTATDMELDRRVAIKTMHPHLAAQERFQKRFLQEARAIARLKHPNVITIYDAKFEEGRLFLVMELIEGGNLYDQIQLGTLPLPEAVGLVRQIADGLHYAHDQGVIHRDIKPHNILLKPASSPAQRPAFQALLVDFGLAKLTEGILDSVTGMTSGTFAYMSPEQCTAQRIDPRSDIYSLGVVLFEVVTGQRPFDPKTLPQAINMHTQQFPPPINTLKPGVPVQLENIIKRCLAKDPNERYQTAYDVYQDLGVFLDSMAHSPTEMEKTVPEMPEGLMTDPMAQPIPMAPPTHAPMTWEQTGQDRLRISREGHPTQVRPLTGGTVRIGRASDNDLVLERGQKVAVSRYHAVLEKRADGYWITDKGSTNGTYLGEQKLEPERSQKWELPAVVRLGDYWLEIEQAAAEPEKSPDTIPPMQNFGGVGPAQQAPVHAAMDIAMTPEPLSVQPGQLVAAQVTILNRDENHLVAHFDIEIEGLPAEWVRVAPQRVQLMPSHRGNATITIQPPHAMQSRAGQHPFRVKVTSSNNPNEPAYFDAVLMIGAFYNFEVFHQPEHMIGRGTVNVNITNEGNAAEVYELQVRDLDDALKMSSPTAKVTVQPGQTETVVFPLAPRRRALIGGPQKHNYEIVIEGQERDATRRGDMLVKPLIPSSVAGILVALATMACLILTLLFIGVVLPERQRQLDAQATATAEEVQAIAAATRAIADAAATATHDALNAEGTATAQWFDDDPDGDGLDNRRELELDTDPYQADTDGDGLTDGQEVRIYNTNPLNPDTDNDGLLDGDEINLYGTDPLNRDTDGDGLGDARELERGTDPTLRDTDGDGIPDDRDTCQNATNLGYGFDAQGCPNPVPTSPPPTAFPTSTPTSPPPGITPPVLIITLPVLTLLPPVGAPEDFIVDYYDAIGSRNYGFTWSHLTDVFKNRWNCPQQYQVASDEYACNVPDANSYDYAGYVNWWNTVKQVDVTHMQRICMENGFAVIRTSLDYIMFNPGSNFVQENRYVKLRYDNGTNEWYFWDVGSSPRTCVFDPAS